MLEELIRYNHAANGETIRSFLSPGKTVPEAERLFSHILNAQHIWCSRMLQRKPLYDRFDQHPLATFGALQDQATAELTSILAAGDLDRQVTYSNSAGEQFSNSVRDILFHVVNHSTYHRAQVATLIRANGGTPAVTDFVLMKREGRL